MSQIVSGVRHQTNNTIALIQLILQWKKTNNKAMGKFQIKCFRGGNICYRDWWGGVIL
jgi:hypothetical protein